MTIATRCEHDAPAWACRICAATEPCPDNCPYCAGEMCARLDGLGCTHDAVERHGYDNLAASDPLRAFGTDTDPGPPWTIPTVDDDDRGLWLGWVLLLAAFALGIVVGWWLTS